MGNISKIRVGGVTYPLNDSSISEELRREVERAYTAEGEIKENILGIEARIDDLDNKISSGEEGDKKLEERISEINSIVKENEKVTAHALNELREDLNGIVDSIVTDIPIATTDVIGGVKSSSTYGRISDNPQGEEFALNVYDNGIASVTIPRANESYNYGVVKVDGSVKSDSMNPVSSKGVAKYVEDAINNIEIGDIDLSDYAKKVDLSNVATSGSYNDLTNKPTIPAVVTESTVSGWGFTKNTGTYIKPSTGIPKTDLASAVQTSLGKADTALQSYTEQYKGTVTGVKINGTTKNPSSGVVDLGTVITSHQDISGKQDKLVSGTNIKTINGTSILGSGNIVISGDGAYAEINHGISDTTFTLTPNVFHVWGTVSNLILTIGNGNNGIANEYLFQFTSGSNATSLTLPSNIKWTTQPNIQANKTYQISILNNLGTILEF